VGQPAGLALASVSLLAVISLTIRDQHLAGWTTTAVVAAVAWLAAPALLYGKLRSTDRRPLQKPTR